MVHKSLMNIWHFMHENRNQFFLWIDVKTYSYGGEQVSTATDTDGAMGGHQIVNICLLRGALYKQVKSLHTSIKPAMSMMS